MGEIILTFEWDGQTIHKETKGFTGKQCVSKTQFIEDALGNPGDRKFKSEYYEDGNTEQERLFIIRGDKLKH